MKAPWATPTQVAAEEKPTLTLEEKKARRREQARDWARRNRAANPEKVRAHSRKWWEANREEARAATRKWAERNPDKALANEVLKREAIRKDPVLRATENARRRARYARKKAKQQQEGG